MAETYTLGEVAELLNTVVAGIRTGGSGDDRVYSLPEVSERTGFAVTSLEEDCRRGTIEHTKRGRTVGMTSRQIAMLVTQYARGGGASAPVVVDALDQARQMSRQSGGRRRGRGRAA